MRTAHFPLIAPQATMGKLVVASSQVRVHSDTALVVAKGHTFIRLPRQGHTCHKHVFMQIMLPSVMVCVSVSCWWYVRLPHSGPCHAPPPHQAAGSEAALASANARLSALQRQLAVATAEKQELAARLAAADMEAAGSAEVGLGALTPPSCALVQQSP